MGMSLHNLLTILVLYSEKSPPHGQRQMAKLKGSRGVLERYFAPLQTGSNKCISFSATIVPSLIVLLVLYSYCSFWTINQGQATLPCSDAYRLGYDPVALREQDAQQRLKMKCHAESKGAIRECDIQVWDTVLAKQPRRGKLSTPYQPTPLIVTDKNQSMLTVEGANPKVTRNSSYFKRFLTGCLWNIPLMLTWKPVPCLLHLPRVRSLQTLGLLTLPIVPRPRLKSCFEGLPDCPSLRRNLFNRFDQILFNTYVDYEHCCWTFLILDMSC